MPAKYPLHTTWETERERESEGAKAREPSLETVDKEKLKGGEKKKKKERGGGQERRQEAESEEDGQCENP